MTKLINVILIIILLTSCSIKSIEKLKVDSINYSRLPDTVKFYFYPSNNYIYQRTLICLDKDLETKFQLYTTKEPAKLFWYGFKYHLTINDNVFSLKANKGMPFIILDTILYYTDELMANSKNFNKIVYKKVYLVLK